MKILGLITEYNPFHKGHLYHLHQSRKVTDPDVTIAIMSGEFLQRGEPALLSKWERAKAAVASGVDLVFELPYQYAVQPADLFAKGAVSMLTSAGVTDIVFGSEHGVTDDFITTAKIAVKAKKEIDSLVKLKVRKGERFPKAYAEAVHAVSGQTLPLDLSHPNNSLGYHYTREALEMGSPIRMHTVRRVGAGYHNPRLQPGNFSSATAIRDHLLRQDEPLENLSEAVPEPMMKIISQSVTNHTLSGWHKLYPFLQYRLITSSNSTLSATYDCDEGLENRLIKHARAKDYPAFLEAVSTKRYTKTRIQRLLVHLLVNVERTEMIQAKTEKPAFRLLAMNDRGRKHLNALKRTGLNIASKQTVQNGFADSIHKRACDIYHLPFINNPRFTEEYQRRPYIHSEE